MERFHIIDQAEAIVSVRSVFKQVKVYQRDGALYIGAAGGFVRLYANHATGLPNMRWDDIDIPGVAATELKTDGVARLSLPNPIKTISA